MSMVAVVFVALAFVGVAVGALYLMTQKYLLRLTNVNSDQHKANKTEIETGVKDILDNHQKLLNEIVKGLEKQLEHSGKEVSSLKDQNTALKEQLIHHAKITEGLQVSAEGLKQLLSNNRLRGKWGEQVAEDLLLAAG